MELKKLSISVGALLLLMLAATAAVAEDVNRIVLRVNEEIVTLHEYEERKAGEISTILADQRLDSSQRQERLEQAGKVVMQSTFSEMLLLSFQFESGSYFDGLHVVFTIPFLEGHNIMA